MSPWVQGHYVSATVFQDPVLGRRRGRATRCRRVRRYGRCYCDGLKNPVSRDRACPQRQADQESWRGGENYAKIRWYRTGRYGTDDRWRARMVQSISRSIPCAKRGLSLLCAAQRGPAGSRLRLRPGASTLGPGPGVPGPRFRSRPEPWLGLGRRTRPVVVTGTQYSDGR